MPNSKAGILLAEDIDVPKKIKRDSDKPADGKTKETRAPGNILASVQPKDAENGDYTERRDA